VPNGRVFAVLYRLMRIGAELASDARARMVGRRDSGVRQRRRLCADERGAQIVEYLLLVGLVAIVGLAGFRAFGSSVDEKAAAHAERVARLEGTDVGGPTPAVPGVPGEGSSGAAPNTGTTQAALDALNGAADTMAGWFGTSGTSAVEITQGGKAGPITARVGVRAEEMRITVPPVPVPGLETRVRLVVSQAVTLFAEAGAGSPHVISVDGRAFTGVQSLFTITTTEEVAAQLGSGQRTVTPFDAQSVPVGTTLMLRSEDYRGTVLDGAFRGIAAVTQHATTDGLAVGVSRVDDSTMRVVVGPTESVINSASLGVNLGVAGATIGTTTILRDEQLRVTDFDISTPEGLAAYQQMMLTGQVPARDPAAGVVRSGKTEVVDLTRLGGFEAHVGIGRATVEVGGQSIRSGWTLTQTNFDDGSKEYREQLVRPGAGEAVYLTEDVDAQGKSSGTSITYGYRDLSAIRTSYMVDAFAYPSHVEDVPNSAVEISLSPADAQALSAQARESVRQLRPRATPAELQAHLENEASYGPMLSSSFVAELALAKDAAGVANAFANNSPGAVAEGLLSISYETERRVPGTIRRRPTK
jgi:Flp pilus assembly pilin Flp